MRTVPPRARRQRTAPATAAATEISRVGTCTSPPYGCIAESASTVAAPVTGGAGAGKP
ncbi:hypothetical protein [Streptomyces chartreusis]|uniref:hypothetical protein n=1 Tax=Streptomyces chartreusis TaxID=1969 RepID=UPI003F4D0BB4